jgi:hypothetical protein
MAGGVGVYDILWTYLVRHRISGMPSHKGSTVAVDHNDEWLAQYGALPYTTEVPEGLRMWLDPYMY